MRRSAAISCVLLILLCALGSTGAAAPDARRGLGTLSVDQRRAVALEIITATFDNRFGNDRLLLSRVSRAAQRLYHRVPVDQVEIDRATRGLSLRDRQVLALRTILRHERHDERLAAEAAKKLGALGDRSALRDLRRAMYRGGSTLIPAVVQAVRELGQREGLPPRRRLDLRRFRSRRDRVEAVLRRGTIKRVEPLASDTPHTFPAYLVTFENELGGQPLRALFKPTGAKERQNWCLFDQDDHGKTNGYAFVAREVFSYEFDKQIRAGRVPPTVAATIDVPGLGPSLGSLQYFIPAGKTLGQTWDRTRPRYRDLEKSTAGIRQLDTLKLLSWVAGSPEHVPCEVRQGNKCNIFVADSDPFPRRGSGAGAGAGAGGSRMMMIDNAASWTNIRNIHDKGDWMLPLRSNGRLIRNLRRLDRDKFIDQATPLIGADEARGAWWRIRQALDVARTRPEWSSLLRRNLQPQQRRLVPVPETGTPEPLATVWRLAA